MMIPGIDANRLLIFLDVQGFSVSLGSACQSGTAEASPTLKAIGRTESEASSALRLSLWSEIDNSTIEQLVSAILTFYQRKMGK
jgi:cysteine desulfurase